MTDYYVYMTDDDNHPGLTWRYPIEGGLVSERGEVSDDGLKWFPATATLADHEVTA